MVLFKYCLGLLLCLPILFELFVVYVILVYSVVYVRDPLLALAIAYKCDYRALQIAEEVRRVMPLKVKTQKNSVTKYVPLDYREEPNPPVIVMQHLKPIKAARIRDNQFELSTKGKIRSIRMMSNRTEMVVAQLSDFENIVDEAGRAIEFDQTDSESMLDLLPPTIQSELERVFGTGSYDEEAEEELIKQRAEGVVEEDDEDSNVADDDEAPSNLVEE